MRIVLALVIAGLVAAGAGAVVMWWGIYDIAATQQHSAPVYWLLKAAMRRSIEHHAQHIAVPQLRDERVIERGRLLFDEHCVRCHGAPGIAPEPFALGFRPMPANLSNSATEWPPGQLFWTAKYGIKFTGMPGWAFRLPDEDLWAIVAYLQVLPGLSPEQYAAQRPAAEGRTAAAAVAGTVGAHAAGAQATAAGATAAGATGTRAAAQSASATNAAAEGATAANTATQSAGAATASGTQKTATAARATAEGATPAVSAATATPRERPLVTITAAATQPAADASTGDAERGHMLMQQYACITCHEIPGVVGASSPVGPPLARMALRADVAGVAANTPQNLARWLRQPQEMSPGSAMPDLGVTPRDAADMAAYLYTLR